MICCFMNFHEQENAKNLEEHLDHEIERAIDKGCSIFFAGTLHPEDDIFAQRVENIAKFYADGEIIIKRVNDDTDEALKNCFISIADWEIYPY